MDVNFTSFVLGGGGMKQVLINIPVVLKDDVFVDRSKSFGDSFSFFLGQDDATESFVDG